MRHRTGYSRINRTTAHHRAMQRNLAQSLIQHGQVRTTVQKAKDLKPFMERLVTLARKAKDGSITARRQIHKLLSDRSMIPAEHQSEYDDLSMAKRKRALRAPSGRRHRVNKPRGKLAFSGESVLHRLINDVAERFSDRPGGYTRLIKLPKRRIGDGGEQAIVQLVGEEESPGSVTKPAQSARRRRADARYSLAIELAKQRKGSSSAPTAKHEAAAPADAADQQEQNDESTE